MLHILIFTALVLLTKLIVYSIKEREEQKLISNQIDEVEEEIALLTKGKYPKLGHLKKEDEHSGEELYDFSGPVKGVEIRHPSYGVTECVVYVMEYVENYETKTLTPIGLEERVLCNITNAIDGYGLRTRVEFMTFEEYFKKLKEAKENRVSPTLKDISALYSISTVDNKETFIKEVSTLIIIEMQQYKKRQEKLSFVPHTSFFNGDKNLKWEKELLSEPEGEMKHFLQGVHKRVIQNPLPIISASNQLPPPKEQISTTANEELEIPLEEGKELIKLFATVYS